MMTNKRLRVIVADSVQADIEDRDRWWKNNRQGAKVSFAEALRDAYKELRRNANAGVKHEDDEVPGVRRMLLETEHWLYFMAVDRPPLPRYIGVIGVEGPGQEGPPTPPNLTRAVRELP